jgi:hypothetical protein
MVKSDELFSKTIFPGVWTPCPVTSQSAPVGVLVTLMLLVVPVNMEAHPVLIVEILNATITEIIFLSITSPFIS